MVLWTNFENVSNNYKSFTNCVNAFCCLVFIFYECILIFVYRQLMYVWGISFVLLHKSVILTNNKQKDYKKNSYTPK